MLEAGPQYNILLILFSICCSKNGYLLFCIKYDGFNTMLPDHQGVPIPASPKQPVTIIATAITTWKICKEKIGWVSCKNCTWTWSKSIGFFFSKPISSFNVLVLVLVWTATWFWRYYHVFVQMELRLLILKKELMPLQASYLASWTTE